MTQSPDNPATPDPNEPDPATTPPPGTTPPGTPTPPPTPQPGEEPSGYGQATPPPPAYGQATPPPPAYGQPPQPAGVPAGAYGVSSSAPYGIDPRTGIPYSDKQKLLAGLLNILLPFGVGRFYIGDTKIGALQLVVTLVTCGIGGLWSLIDGIMMLVNDDTKDSRGYILRP